MKVLNACAVVVLATGGSMSSLQAAPISLPTSPAVSKAERIVCQGNRRNYTDFNHCMRVNPRGLRYCSRICGE